VGIEIGALHQPFPVPATAQVRYVDRLTSSQLRAEYPELAGLPLVEVDIVADGETLTAIEDASQDFVIASHFLEHCADPIGALGAHLRVLRPGGALLLAVPDRRYGIDRFRPATSLEHILADHEHGPARSRQEHYREWAMLVDRPLGHVAADQTETHAAALEERSYSIHFHCWTPDELAGQLRHILGRATAPARVVERRGNHHEFFVAVRRAEAVSPALDSRG